MVFKYWMSDLIHTGKLSVVGMGIQVYHSTFTVKEYWSLLVWHFISPLVEVNILGCDRILTMILETSSVTTACDLTDVLKQWLSLLTRLESTVQHSNISLLYCGIQLMLFLWSLEKKINTKQCFIHSEVFLYHCLSQSITTYIFCRVNFSCILNRYCKLIGEQN